MPNAPISNPFGFIDILNGLPVIPKIIMTMGIVCIAIMLSALA
jgi:hypothetical protein